MRRLLLTIDERIPEWVNQRLGPVMTWDRLCGVAAVTVFLAAFLPWVTVLGKGVTGINGDGQITLLCAVLSLAALALHRGFGPVEFGHRLTLGTQSAAATMVLLVGIANVSSRAAIGVFLTLFAGLAWFAGVVIGWRLPAPSPLDEVW